MVKFNYSGEIKYHHVTTFRYYGFTTTIRSLCSHFFAGLLTILTFMILSIN